MCGRYLRRGDKQAIAEAMRAEVDFEVVPSYNVAPGTFQPVIRLDREGRRVASLLRWGLIPFWSKDQKIAYRTINAKAETLLTTPAFREAIKHRRCLIPADAFYEWAKTDAKSKQPFLLAMRDGHPFAFAGLWERWKDRTTGLPLETFTIITTDPNELAAEMHDRMPAIIPARDYQRWLAPSGAGELPMDLLRPFPAEEMTAWKVSPAVGNVRNDSPELCTEWE